jgi:hypothetical protein
MKMPRVASALLVSLVAITAGGADFALIHCRADAQMRRTCCCPHDSATDGGSAALKPACCDQEAFSAQRGPSVEARKPLPLDGAVAVRPLTLPAPRHHVILLLPSPISGAGPPIPLFTRALLI